MNRKLYLSNWLSNASVALLIVGGFQEKMETSLRLLALAGAVIAWLLGLILAKRGK